MRRRKKAYRAVIIDLRKVIRTLFLFFVVSLAGVILFLGINSFSKKESVENGFIKFINSMVSTFTGFYPGDFFSVIESEFPEISVYKGSPLWQKAEGEAVSVYNPENADTEETKASPDIKDEKKYPIKSVDTSQIKNLSDSGKKILIKNETGYSVDVSKMLSEAPPVALDKNGPQILILHTHATESYTEEGVDYYDNTVSDRSRDLSKNVVRVGECMAEIFKENGIETVHDTTLHDYPNYNGSYANSLKTGEEYLKKYPSIKMVIDVHRDAIVYGDGTKAKAVTEIKGKKAAQLMFVIGTDAGGLSHPEWRKNLQVAVNLQSKIESKYPGLMRGINLRKERFNEHLTTGSMILEVGTSGNTLKEAIYGAQCAAKVIADALNGK